MQANKKHRGKSNAKRFGLLVKELENDAKEKLLAQAACKPTENRLCSRMIIVSTS